MWKLWSWVYARFYVRTRRRWPHSERADWSALAAVSMVMIANVYTALFLAVGVGIIKVELRGAEPIVAVICLALLAFNYWRFVARGDAQGFIEKMSVEHAAESRSATLKLWSVIVGSAMLMVVVGGIALSPR